MSKNSKIGVIGGGIQGISNALFLQKKGFDVTIFELLDIRYYTINF